MVLEEVVLARKFAVLWPHLNERQRRLVVGAEALVLGRGGGGIGGRGGVPSGLFGGPLRALGGLVGGVVIGPTPEAVMTLEPAARGLVGFALRVLGGLVGGIGIGLVEAGRQTVPVGRRGGSLGRGALGARGAAVADEQADDAAEGESDGEAANGKGFLHGGASFDSSLGTSEYS